MNKNRNTSIVRPTRSNTSGAAALLAIWADLRNGQRRFDAVNRPWASRPRNSR